MRRRRRWSTSPVIAAAAKPFASSVRSMRSAERACS
jgi:hypothetical protein